MPLDLFSGSTLISTRRSCGRSLINLIVPDKAINPQLGVSCSQQNRPCLWSWIESVFIRESICLRLRVERRLRLLFPSAYRFLRAPPLDRMVLKHRERSPFLLCHLLPLFDTRQPAGQAGSHKAF